MQYKIIGRTPDDKNKLDVEVFVQLKYLSNFWRSLDLSLIKCEIDLDLSWSKECIISEASATPRIPGNPAANPSVEEVAKIQTTSVTFQINNPKLYVAVVTLSKEDNIKFLENIKQGFRRTISWNKYRSEIITQPKNNNLDDLIYPTFRNINRLFVILFKDDNNDSTRNSFDMHYMPLVKIKDFHALIDNKRFFDQSVKSKQEAYEKLIEMPRS